MRNFRKFKRSKDDRHSSRGSFNTSNFKASEDTHVEDKSIDTTLISRKMKDIKFETFTATGYSKALMASSKPYPLFGVLNKTLDINYGDSINDLALNAVNYNSDKLSLMIHYPDVAKQYIRFNYNYIPNQVSSVNAAKMIDIQARAFEEITSAARLENFSRLDLLARDELDFTTSYNLSAPSIGINPNKWSRLAGFFNSYQANLSNFALIPAFFNRLRSMIDYMTTMNYQNGDLELASVGKLLRKKTIEDVFSNYNTLLKTTYLDSSWFKIINDVTLTPSRKANEILSPLLTINGYNNVPRSTFTQYTDGTLNTKLVDLMVIDDGITVNAPTVIGSSSTSVIKIQELYLALIDMLSPYNLLRWSRQVANNLIDQTPEAYVNHLVELANIYLRNITNQIVLHPYLQDFITTADRMGLIKWSTGVTFEFNSRDSFSPSHNKIIEDIYRGSMSGNHYINYNPDFLSWEFTTLWDKKRGVVSYDSKRGGLVLVNSFRNMSGISDAIIDNHPVPIFIQHWSNVEILTRRGSTTTIESEEIDSFELRDSLILSRLNIMREGWISKNNLFSLSIPTVVMEEKDYAIYNASLIQSMIQDVFGYGQIIYNRTVPLNNAKEKDKTTVEETRSVFIDPTVFSIISVRTDTYGSNIINDIRRRFFISVPVSNDKAEFSFL